MGAALALCLQASAQAGAADIKITTVLALDPAGPAERTLAPRDPWTVRLAREGFVPPSAGQPESPAVDGKPRSWRAVTLGEQGEASDAGVAQGGLLYLAVESPVTQTVLARGQRNAWLWVNGTLRVGDIYGDGTVHLPIALRAGLNHIVLRGGRGTTALSFADSPASPTLRAEDPTLPDLFERQPAARLDAGLVVMNPLDRWSSPLTVVTRLGNGAERRTEIPPLPPLALRKVAVDFEAPSLALRGGIDELVLQAELHDGQGQVLARQRYPMKIKERADARRVTFRSSIDGSVQYYGLRLADSSSAWGPQRPGLIVALHGANVEAVNLAGSFAAKPWAHVVTPTNRHRFGFNWEEWGRLDLLEVLEHASARLAPDPDRIWLMGHSMGGHGTWINGGLLSDRFAAFAPVAGWATIWSYADAPRPGSKQPVEALLRRASNVADSVELLPNLNSRGLFVLHPGADESVPPTESHALLPLVAQKHRDFAYHERPGAIHWWGNTVVDWPPLLDFLQARRRPPLAEQLAFEFVTPDPAISARFAWLTLAQQRVPLAFSRVTVKADAQARRIELRTDNVQTLSLDLAPLAAHWARAGVAASPALSLEIDGQVLTPAVAAEGRLWLRRGDAQGGGEPVWQTASPPPSDEKGPQRGGRFVDAFRHGVVFVVATGGTEEEKRWALEKARYDAEVFWYRGNGGVQVLRDTDVRPSDFADRNLVLYGNADTHRLWSRLLSDSPLQVRRGHLTVGPHKLQGDDLAVVFVRPRPGHAERSVGVVATTGARGGVVADRLAWTSPGLGFADWLVATPALFERGWAGVRGTGFFDVRWRYSESDSAFNAP